ncbi:hypothetical protein QQF64_032399 [Cirrhinus molitorella]|uniref:Uncharacterized protein n=1 Tax=Cirrhinus molitorella TaxID=172907 RepID=A0ABR3MZP0_9TELE
MTVCSTIQNYRSVLPPNAIRLFVFPFPSRLLPFLSNPFSNPDGLMLPSSKPQNHSVNLHVPTHPDSLHQDFHLIITSLALGSHRRPRKLALYIWPFLYLSFPRQERSLCLSHGAACVLLCSAVWPMYTWRAESGQRRTPALRSQQSAALFCEVQRCPPRRRSAALRPRKNLVTF